MINRPHYGKHFGDSKCSFLYLKYTYSLTARQSPLKIYLQYIHIISHFPCFVVFFRVAFVIHLFVRLFVLCLSVCLSVCLPVCSFIYLFVDLFIYFLGHWKTCKTTSFKSGNIAEMFAAMQAQAASAQDTITS